MVMNAIFLCFCVAFMQMVTLNLANEPDGNEQSSLTNKYYTARNVQQIELKYCMMRIRAIRGIRFRFKNELWTYENELRKIKINTR